MAAPGTDRYIRLTITTERHKTMPNLFTLRTAAGAMFFTASLFCGTSFAQDSEDGFRDIKVAPGVSQADQLIDTIMPFLTGHPESLEGNAGLKLDIQKDDEGFRVDIIKTGYLDDSLSGEHFRGIIIQNAEGRWELLSMQVKSLCARGESTDGKCL